MSLNINKKILNLELKKLNNYIEKYENNSHDIFFELSKLSSNWNDKDSAFFNDKIMIEKQNQSLILENIKKISDLYKEVDNIYISSNIEFNSKNKVRVMSKINNCIDDLKDINNIIYNTIIPNGFYYRSNFVNLKNNIEKNINNLIDYKHDFDIYTNNIKNNEIELLSSINNIEEINIEKF